MSDSGSESDDMWAIQSDDDFMRRSQSSAETSPASTPRCVPPPPMLSLALGTPLSEKENEFATTHAPAFVSTVLLGYSQIKKHPAEHLKVADAFWLDVNTGNLVADSNGTAPSASPDLIHYTPLNENNGFVRFSPSFTEPRVGPGVAIAVGWHSVPSTKVEDKIAIAVPDPRASGSSALNGVFFSLPEYATESEPLVLVINTDLGSEVSALLYVMVSGKDATRSYTAYTFAFSPALAGSSAPLSSGALTMGWSVQQKQRRDRLLRERLAALREQEPWSLHTRPVGDDESMSEYDALYPPKAPASVPSPSPAPVIESDSESGDESDGDSGSYSDMGGNSTESESDSESPVPSPRPFPPLALPRNVTSGIDLIKSMFSVEGVPNDGANTQAITGTRSAVEKYVEDNGKAYAASLSSETRQSMGPLTSTYDAAKEAVGVKLDTAFNTTGLKVWWEDIRSDVLRSFFKGYKAQSSETINTEAGDLADAPQPFVPSDLPEKVWKGIANIETAVAKKDVEGEKTAWETIYPEIDAYVMENALAYASNHPEGDSTKAAELTLEKLTEVFESNDLLDKWNARQYPPNKPDLMKTFASSVEYEREQTRTSTPFIFETPAPAGFAPLSIGAPSPNIGPFHIFPNPRTPSTVEDANEMIENMRTHDRADSPFLWSALPWADKPEEIEELAFMLIGFIDGAVEEKLFNPATLEDKKLASYHAQIQQIYRDLSVLRSATHTVVATDTDNAVIAAVTKNVKNRIIADTAADMEEDEEKSQGSATSDSPVVMDEEGARYMALHTTTTESKTKPTSPSLTSIPRPVRDAEAEMRRQARVEEEKEKEAAELRTKKGTKKAKQEARAAKKEKKKEEKARKKEKEQKKKKKTKKTKGKEQGKAVTYERKPYYDAWYRHFYGKHSFNFDYSGSKDLALPRILDIVKGKRFGKPLRAYADANEPVSPTGDVVSNLWPRLLVLLDHITILLHELPILVSYIPQYTKKIVATFGITKRDKWHNRELFISLLHPFMGRLSMWYERWAPYYAIVAARGIAIHTPYFFFIEGPYTAVLPKDMKKALAAGYEKYVSSPTPYFLSYPVFLALHRHQMANLVRTNMSPDSAVNTLRKFYGLSIDNVNFVRDGKDVSDSDARLVEKGTGVTDESSLTDIGSDMSLYDSETAFDVALDDVVLKKAGNKKTKEKKNKKTEKVPYGRPAVKMTPQEVYRRVDKMDKDLARHTPRVESLKRYVIVMPPVVLQRYLEAVVPLYTSNARHLFQGLSKTDFTFWAPPNEKKYLTALPDDILEARRAGWDVIRETLLRFQFSTGANYANSTVPQTELFWTDEARNMLRRKERFGDFDPKTMIQSLIREHNQYAESKHSVLIPDDNLEVADMKIPDPFVAPFDLALPESASNAKKSAEETRKEIERMQKLRLKLATIVRMYHLRMFSRNLGTVAATITNGNAFLYLATLRSDGFDDWLVLPSLIFVPSGPGVIRDKSTAGLALSRIPEYQFLSWVTNAIIDDPSRVPLEQIEDGDYTTYERLTTMKQTYAKSMEGINIGNIKEASLAFVEVEKKWKHLLALPAMKSTDDDVADFSSDPDNSLAAFKKTYLTDLQNVAFVQIRARLVRYLTTLKQKGAMMLGDKDEIAYRDIYRILPNGMYEKRSLSRDSASNSSREEEEEGKEKELIPEFSKPDFSKSAPGKVAAIMGFESILDVARSRDVETIARPRAYLSEVAHDIIPLGAKKKGIWATIKRRTKSAAKGVFNKGKGKALSAITKKVDKANVKEGTKDKNRAEAKEIAAKAKRKAEKAKNKDKLEEAQERIDSAQARLDAKEKRKKEKKEAKEEKKKKKNLDNDALLRPLWATAVAKEEEPRDSPTSILKSDARFGSGYNTQMQLTHPLVLQVQESSPVDPDAPFTLGEGHEVGFFKGETHVQVNKHEGKAHTISRHKCRHDHDSEAPITWDKMKLLALRHPEKKVTMGLIRGPFGFLETPVYIEVAWDVKENKVLTYRTVSMDVMYKDPKKAGVAVPVHVRMEFDMEDGGALHAIEMSSASFDRDTKPQGTASGGPHGAAMHLQNKMKRGVLHETELVAQGMNFLAWSDQYTAMDLLGQAHTGFMTAFIEYANPTHVEGRALPKAEYAAGVQLYHECLRMFAVELRHIVNARVSVYANSSRQLAKETGGSLVDQEMMEQKTRLVLQKLRLPHGEAEYPVLGQPGAMKVTHFIGPMGALRLRTAVALNVLGMLFFELALKAGLTLRTHRLENPSVLELYMKRAAMRTVWVLENGPTENPYPDAATAFPLALGLERKVIEATNIAARRYVGMRKKWTV